MSETEGKANLTCLLAIAEVEASELEEENDTMRQQLADVTESMGRVEERCAKLRALLQRTWDAFHAATAREFRTVKNELRELGIEVD